MSGNLTLCDVDPVLKEKLNKFNFRKEKNNAAIVMKINVEKHTVEFEEEFEDCDIDELQSELPEHSPRYIALSYVLKHGDGRVSYPLMFIFLSPQGAKPEHKMLYAGSKLHVVGEGKFTKVFEIRNVEEFTEEWVQQKLLK